MLKNVYMFSLTKFILAFKVDKMSHCPKCKIVSCIYNVLVFAHVQSMCTLLINIPFF